MRNIYKFPLMPGDTIPLPAGAVPRLVANQLGIDCAWFEVQTNAPAREHLVVKVGTGGNIAPDAMYLGTVLECHGQFVWHYYLVPA